MAVAVNKQVYLKQDNDEPIHLQQHSITKKAGVLEAPLPVSRLTGPGKVGD